MPCRGTLDAFCPPLSPALFPASVCPIFQVSNVTGDNLDLLRLFLNLLNPRVANEDEAPAEFQIDDTFSVPVRFGSEAQVPVPASPGRPAAAACPPSVAHRRPLFFMVRAWERSSRERRCRARCASTTRCSLAPTRRETFSPWPSRASTAVACRPRCAGEPCAGRGPFVAAAHRLTLLSDMFQSPGRAQRADVLLCAQARQALGDTKGHGHGGARAGAQGHLGV